MNDQERKRYEDIHPSGEAKTWRVAIVFDIQARGEVHAVARARGFAVRRVEGFRYLKTCTRGMVGEPSDGGIQLGEIE